MQCWPAVAACAERIGLDRVVLSGGVFQNRLLTEMVYTCLPKAGFRVFSPPAGASQ